MDSETKVVYHGATVVDASTTNPPPYAGYPPPGPAGYPPPGPAGYPPPGPAGYGPPSAVIHTSTPATVIVAQQVGPQPMPTVCRSCNAEIVSRVEKQSSTKTHLFALGLCLLG
ncbi:Uncharacterized protein OBRU01_26363 [Operophtera brumata]|uniref:LITAF domain-containing protein n=1 Tax=Operophtera brumata TaxID=104452 RepID=A0A0L7K335_OPEBR|nr:Uncharacterized protein OBRU01_26363 [Operophtera brumata]